MNKWLIIILIAMSMMLSGCHTTKHMQIERLESSEQYVNVNERTDKNTVRLITITEYREKKDSTTGEYPVNKITKIEEVNKDVVKTEKESTTKTDSQEVTQVKQETKPSWKIYVWCFVGGVVVTLLVILIIKLIIAYFKK